MQTVSIPAGITREEAIAFGYSRAGYERAVALALEIKALRGSDVLWIWDL